MTKRNKITIILTSTVLAILLIVVLAVIIFQKQRAVIIPSAKKVVIENNEESAWQDGKQGEARVWLETMTENIESGEEFVITVFIDTDSKNIVLAAIELEFDPSLVELVSKKFEKSDFKISILNEHNRDSLQVVRGNAGDTNWQDSDDGFTGEKGLVGDFYFRAKKSGLAEFSFIETDSEKDNIGTMFLLDDGESTILETQKNNLRIGIN
jgi:hypothetical protein